MSSEYDIESDYTSTSYSQCTYKKCYKTAALTGGITAILTVIAISSYYIIMLMNSTIGVQTVPLGTTVQLDPSHTVIFLVNHTAYGYPVDVICSFDFRYNMVLNVRYDNYYNNNKEHETNIMTGVSIVTKYLVSDLHSPVSIGDSITLKYANVGSGSGAITCSQTN